MAHDGQVFAGRDDALEQAELAAAVRQHRTRRDAFARVDQTAEIAVEPFLADSGRQCVDHGTDRLHPRPHRGRPIAFQAATPNNQCAKAISLGGDLFEQSRLASPGFALDDHQRVAASQRRLDGAAQYRQFVGPTDENACRRRLLGDRRRGVRLGEHLLLGGLQRNTGVDAEVVGEP